MDLFSQIIILVLLIAMNGFFAGSEIAFISLNTNKLKQMAEEGNKAASKVLLLKEIPTKFLSTIQIGVSLASMFSGAFAADAFANILTDWIVNMGYSSAGVVKPLAMIAVTLITSYLMLVFGELVPKRLAMSNPQRFAFIVVYPVWFLSIVFTPIIKLLSMSTNLVLIILGIDPNKSEDEVTEEEIRLMVDAGEIDISEKEMINNIFEFDNTDVTDIMTHRTDIIGLDVDSSFDEIVEVVESQRYTRYPVFEESIDNIVGILHLRDLLPVIKGDGNGFNIKDIIRQPYFVPDSKLINELFVELKEQKNHIAVVIDEYGGTAGIVTMEDVIEEVMGNIMDEYDDEEDETDIIKMNDNEYIVSGICDIEDLDTLLPINLPIDDYETVSGFVIGELGRMPQLEDINNVDSAIIYEGYIFTILELDEKVIGRVSVIKDTNTIEEEKE